MKDQRPPPDVELARLNAEEDRHTINDRRRELGLPPIRGGDVPLSEWVREDARRRRRGQPPQAVDVLPETEPS